MRTRSLPWSLFLAMFLLGLAACGGGSSAPPPPVNHTISGNAGVAGALITYTGGTTTASATGAYSFTVAPGATGTLTPTLAGYAFTPASRSYTNVNADQTSQNFTAAPLTYTLSGSLGASGAGATLSYTDGTAKTATADASGSYSFTVSYDWSGTVTPSKTGFAFTPASATFSHVLANQVQNFATSALVYTLSGSLGASGAGATLSYTDGTAKTATADGSGTYSFVVSYDWSGTVTPSKTGFTFSPASATFSHVLANQVQDFAASAIVFTLSGSLGAPGAGATLGYTDGTARTATADASGNYSFSVSYDWSGTVTPSPVTGYALSPASRSYAHVLADQPAQDYTYTPITFTISGYAGLTDGLVAYTDGTAKTAVIDGTGHYSFSVSYNWTGTVTPARTGYTFFPASRSYTQVLSDQPAQDYTAELNPVATISPSASWNLPAAPYATVGRTYLATVPVQAGATITWSVDTGSATFTGATDTDTATFTPTAVGVLTLKCVVSKASLPTATGFYQVAVEPPLTALPANLSTGQGTLLLPVFSGTGLINPGALPVTSGVGLAVFPAATTTYTLNVDGSDVSSATVTVQDFTPTFVYVANHDSSVSAFTLDGATGGLTEVPGSPYTALTVSRITQDPAGRFLFASGRNNGVYVFSIETTPGPAFGALTQVPGSPFVTEPGLLTTSVAVDPLGRFVYVNSDHGKIYVFTLDAGTGVLTPVAGAAATSRNNFSGELLVHPSGKFLFAACSNTDVVEAFVIDPASGALTPVVGSPFDTGVSVTGLSVDGTTKLIAGPDALAMNPSGDTLVVKGQPLPNELAAPGKVALFQINAATGALAPVPNAPFTLGIASGNLRQGLCYHPTRNLLFTSIYDTNAPDAEALVPDTAAGTLTPTAESPYRFFTVYGSDCLAVDRSGRFAFAANRDFGVIRRMRVDGSGILRRLDGTTPISPIPISDPEATPVGIQPCSIAVVGSLL